MKEEGNLERAKKQLMKKLIKQGLHILELSIVSVKALKIENMREQLMLSTIN